MNALNEQTYYGVQKILVNNARSAEEIEHLRSIGALTLDWEVINFLESAYVYGDAGSVWRWPGSKALEVVVGEYVFFQSDDDFLAKDFFERMARLFERYPDAICGSGLPVSYLWDSDSVLRPSKGSWQSRPVYESGRKLVNKHLKDSSYMSNPGFSMVMETAKVRESKATIFEAGFPDLNSLYQVALRGTVVFDRDAEMFWGRHEGQDHKQWDREHKISSFYRENLDSSLKFNVQAMQRFVPDSKSEQNALRKLFNTTLAELSSEILIERFLQKLHLIPIPREMKGKTVDIVGHVMLLSRAPLHSCMTLVKILFLTVKGGLRWVFTNRK